MAGQARQFVYVLPAKQQIVLAQYALDELRRELLADGAAVLVKHDAARLVQHLPPALPGHVAEVGVFQVERLQQRVKAAQLQELVAVESAASAAAVEAGKEVRHRRVVAMTHAQGAVLPPGLRQAGFFAQLVGVGEEDLAGDREYVRIAKALQQRHQKIRRHPHIAVQQHHDIVLRRAKAGVGAAPESQVARQRLQVHLREVGAQVLRAAIGGAVVHHHDFVLHVAGQRRDHARQVLLQQVAPVPIWNDYTGGVRARRPGRR